MKDRFVLPMFRSECSDLLQGEDEASVRHLSLYSFDVSSLCTNVPVDEAVQVIRDRLQQAKVCAPLGVKPVFRPKRTLKRELMQVKSRTPEQKQTGVVYKIPCKECPEVYVGETKRTLKVRLSEHRQAVKRGDPKNGIAVHVQKTIHCINWEGATVQRRA